MKPTRILKVTPRKPAIEDIRVAAGFIRKGGLVAFPTETVYGLGADALNAKAVLSLFQAKKRPLDNPPIVHIARTEDIHRLVKTVPSNAEKLIGEFWPGPLTLIFRRSEAVPSITVAGLETIAIRMPRHEVALALVEESHSPIAAPSANLAGKPSPTAAQHVLNDLAGRIDVILDAGETDVGVESTVLDLTTRPAQIMRPGGISFESLKKILPSVQLSSFVTTGTILTSKAARSPGTKHKHYAPKADVFLVEGKLEKVVEKVNELAVSHIGKSRKVGIMCTDETLENYKVGVVKSLGSRKNLEIIAHNLFRCLREFDFENVDVVISESMPKEGIGLAIMDRLRRASDFKTVIAH